MTTTLTEGLIAELAQEAATTRRVLERVPEDRLSWAPHPKSLTLGQLALHVAGIPGALGDMLSEPVRDVSGIPRPEAASRAELLAALDASIDRATHALSGWTTDDLVADWTMKVGGVPVLTVPRIDMVRSVMFNHVYHHRGQLTVYLRLLDVPVPSVYGDSADEKPIGMS